MLAKLLTPLLRVFHFPVAAPSATAPASAPPLPDSDLAVRTAAIPQGQLGTTGVMGRPAQPVATPYHRGVSEAAALAVNFDPKCHGAAHPHSDFKKVSEGGFVKAPTDRLDGLGMAMYGSPMRNDPYLPPGDYMVGKRFRVEIYEPEGMRIFEGEMLGTTEDWESYLMRDIAADEIVKVPARRDGTMGGIMHRLYWKPGEQNDTYRAEASFLSRYADSNPIAEIPDFYDLRRDGIRRAFLVSLNDFYEVVVGTGHVRIDEDRILYTVEITASDGKKYFLPQWRIRGYTRGEVPAEPDSTT